MSGKKMIAPETMFTAKAMAARLGVSVSTVYRLKQTGGLPYIQPGGKRHFVRFSGDVLQMPSEPGPHTKPATSIAKKPIPGPKPKWTAEE